MSGVEVALWLGYFSLIHFLLGYTLLLHESRNAQTKLNVFQQYALSAIQLKKLDYILVVFKYHIRL